MRLSVAAFLATLASLLGASFWLDQSVFVPVVGPDWVSYYFCAQPAATLLGSIAIAAALLVAVHLGVHAFVVRRGQPWAAATLADVRYLAPLSLVAVNLLALVVLDERWRDLLAPLAYVAMDLRWPMAIAAVALSLLALRAQAPPLFRSRSRTAPIANPEARSLAIDLALAVAVMAFAIVTTPHIRFTAFATGDEPKYIRFAENWFQGKGMQIDQFKNVNDLPTGDKTSHLLRNLTYVGPALRENAWSLAADAATLRDPANWTRRFNRAESADNHVVRGKNGWHYQIHGPGLSVLILPAYVIDRKFFDRGTSLFADDMFTTSTLMLLVYAALALVVYRLAMAAGAHTTVSAIAAAVLILSLPVAAFPFQFYPETVAGVITCATALRILQAKPLTYRSALAISVALTFMGWLHVRFLVVSGVAMAWLLWSCRHQSRAVLAALVVSFGLGMSTLCFYAYHVTGSILPSAPFALGVGSGFVWDRVPVGLMAMLIDRVYGLLPLAPIYLLAIAGTGLMIRRQPRTLAIIATLAVALIVPSAGQGYWTDGSVPLRHALAVLPLAVVPLALWLGARGRRPLAAAVAVLLIGISLRTAAAYNLQNDKSITTMLDAAFAGWDVSLLAPITHRIRANPLTVDAWQMMLAAALAVGAFAFGALSNDEPPKGERRAHYASAFAIVTLALVVLGSTVIALGGLAHRWELLRAYRPPAPQLPSCSVEAGTPPPRRY